MIPEDIFTEKNLSCARRKRQETHLKSIAPARIFSRFTIAPKHAIISSVAMNGNAFPIPDEESRAAGASADGKGWPLARERFRYFRRLAHVTRKSGPVSGQAEWYREVVNSTSSLRFCRDEVFLFPQKPFISPIKKEENPMELNDEISTMLTDYKATRLHETPIRFLTPSRFADILE